MKIRTDFVTNSSSGNYAEVVIDNPVLLEILQKYKDVGLFGNREPFIGIGNFETEVNDFGGVNAKRGGIQTPTFYLCVNNTGGFCENFYYYFNAPVSIVDVLKKIIRFFSEVGNSKPGYVQDQINSRLLAELREREEDINHNYLWVSWTHKGSEDTYDVWSEYQFDPVVGERYSGDIWEGFEIDDKEDEDEYEYE